MRRTTIIAVFVCCLAALGVAACSSSGSTSTASSSTAAAITIKNLHFTVVSTVKAGSTVTVKNNDGFGHTVSQDSGGFDVQVSGNGTATFKAPSKPGTYAFHCNIHPQMHGKLTVT
ncbi:MAG TPA: cupredoxin domain-containing protein [Acidimicrobiia bacterium]|jgi:plastocyanin